MLANTEDGIDQKGIQKLIEDVVAKMYKTGKSFKVIATLLLMPETEVIAAFKRYQNRMP